MDLTATAAQAFSEFDKTNPPLFILRRTGHARLFAGEDLIMAGREIFTECLKFADTTVDPHWNFADGQLVLKGQALGWFKGDVASICRSESIALSFLGALSGIATLTQCFVRACEGTNAQISPGPFAFPLLTNLQRHAVIAGGGVVPNFANPGRTLTPNVGQMMGSLSEAVRQMRETSADIEIECRSKLEVTTALELGATGIVLIDFNPDELSEVLPTIPTPVTVCVAGRFQIDEIAGLAQTGVRTIRVDHLISSAPSADFALRLE